MLLEQKRHLIETGQQELKKGVFPNKLLEKIKDSRLRNDVSNQIFYPNGTVFNQLSDQEKIERKSRLKIILEFQNYLQSFEMFKRASYILLIVGLITLISSIVGANNNLMFGVITMTIGIFNLIVSFNKELILKMVFFISVLYVILYITELLFIRFPDPYIYMIDNDILASRRGTLIKIINAISPLIYVTVRITIGLILFIVYKKQTRFKKEKEKFELS